MRVLPMFVGLKGKGKLVDPIEDLLLRWCPVACVHHGSVVRSLGRIR